MRSENYLGTNAIRTALLLGSLCLMLQSVFAQNTQLTLSRILIALQTKENSQTLAQRNATLIKDVQLNGVTFKLVPDIEKELITAGATTSLLNAIRQKTANMAVGPMSAPTPAPKPVAAPASSPDPNKPDAKYERIWIEPNVVQDNAAGMRIHAKFSVYNLKDVPSDIVYRFEKDGTMLKGKGQGYTTKSGDLSARRLLKPAYAAAAFQEYVFIPYSEFNLSQGTYALKLDADVIQRDGTMVKHLTLQNFTLVIPNGPVTNSTKATHAIFDKMWIEYDRTADGKLGMIVHTKATVNNASGKEVYLQLLFEKNDGTKLYGNNQLFRNKAGLVAAYKLLKPTSDALLYEDIAVFFPYEALNLGVGSYDLRFNADLIYPDYSTIQHLKLYSFTYKRSK